ncbi:DUF1638 domain-containing protein [Rhodospirillaceae bacterium KN72]|uniref:DUF1638 domain-containing protein n=1 Tax=Pacificispira spongiicola TaxID=2729598 RepID=A0A7Y0E3Q7_9PROT|nr:DUF1638 domain-containing protein [Pacificispira spongiicola]NMM45886.1 DUF1638 domain-containing protein [Pacificispira spongiicola]
MADTFPDTGPAPDAAPEFPAAPTGDNADGAGKVLVIACGALAREILDLSRLNGWDNLSVACLPAKLHNTPQQIPDLLRDKIRAKRDGFDRIFVAYADCGTGGLIDRVVEQEGAVRIGGPHCYSFFTGGAAFEALAEEEIGSFYLTDYLARHFETLILDGMGLRKYPQMRDMLFGNYKRLVYLAQTDDADLDRKAEAAAEALGLRYERRWTGYGELADFLQEAAEQQQA